MLAMLGWTLMMYYYHGVSCGSALLPNRQAATALVLPSVPEHPEYLFSHMDWIRSVLCTSGFLVLDKILGHP